MPIENKIMLDPRLVSSDTVTQFNLLGPKNILPYRTSANSANGNNIQFVTQLSPSDNQLLNSTMILEIVYTATNNAGAILPNAANMYTNVAANTRPTVAFRSLGALRNMSELSFTVNNSKLSMIPINDLVNLGDFLYTKQEAKSLSSYFPAQLDMSPVLYPEGTANCVQYNQPLSVYANSDDGTSRACNTILNSDGTTITHYVPLVISPFGKGYYSTPSLANVQEFSLNINFADSDHNLEFCGSVTDRLAGVAIQSAYLHYGYVQPNDEVEIPRETMYQYDNIVTLVKNIDAPKNTGVSSTVDSDSYKVNVCPKLVYFSISPDMSQSTTPANILNVHARINKCNILWGSKGSSFLSSYDAYDLWKMTMVNTGSDMSFQHWRNSCGVVCIRPATDIGNDLSTLEGEVGSSVMFTIQSVQYDIQNIVNAGVAAAYTTNINWRLYTTIVSSGYVTLADGQLQLSTSVISPAEAVVAVDGGMVSSDVVKTQAGEAGRGLWDSLKSIYHKGHNLVRKGAQFLQSDLGKKAVSYLSGSGISAGGMIVQQKPRKR